MGLAVLGLALLLSGWRRAAPPGQAASGEVALVLTARALDAGAVLTAADIQVVRAPGAEVLAGFAHALADVVGRRLAVAVPSGQALSGALLTDVPVVAAGHRLMRLPLDGASAPPDMHVGAVVDVLAAVPDGAAGGRVVVVATARLAAVDGGTSPVATLEVDSAGAARLVWAQTFAKSLRVLVRGSAGDETAPPPVTGLGP